MAFLMPQFLPKSSGESTKVLCDRLKNPDLFDQGINDTNLEEIETFGRSEGMILLIRY